jgi:hypothetical protein
MDDVESFLFDLEGVQAETAWFLHQQIMSYPEVKCKLRYKIPFYDRKSWICYINPVKNSKVELVFIRGNELDDYEGVLQARGRKMVKGLVFDGPHTLVPDLLHAILQDALLLDEKVKYSFRRK